MVVECIPDCGCLFLVSLCRGVPCGSKPFGLLQIFQVILGVIETAETIESLTQPELLYFGLKAERQSEDRPGTLLECMADQATALMLAEAATQDDRSVVVVE